MTSVMSWNGRINELLKVNQYDMVFKLAFSIYRDEASYVVIGVQKYPSKRREAVGEYIEMLIIKYLAYVLNQIQENIKNDLEAILNMIFSYCIEIKKEYLIFGHIHDFAQQTQQISIYVNSNRI